MRLKRRERTTDQRDGQRHQQPEVLDDQHFEPLRTELAEILGCDPDELRPHGGAQ